jgi:NADPH-dependent 2,4-dienoyl-CoA reductase/sulfur reductase-like enzyme
MPKSIDVLLDGSNRSLQQLYGAYNNAYFGNQLNPGIRVRYSKQPMRKHMAEYDSENEEIVIDRRFKRLRRITCWLLMHEMNHIYVGPEEDHSAVFNGGMFRLASIDLKIAGTEHLTTSEQFLELDELPKRILFVGGGYITFEFAHVVVRAGAQVTIAHRGPRPLPRFDPDLVDQLVKSSRELGVDVQLGSEVIGVEKSSGQLVVRACASGQQRTFEADIVVHAAGRARLSKYRLAVATATPGVNLTTT